ncbi:glycosyltransferase family 87 protein [Sinomonas halotolerans]|uniref:Glycosyltransferase 87 family protein n=1 Tax=Sinomonas halotolerans TaxID=1644133 RepID=A0ABU9X274_9MICC
MESRQDGSATHHHAVISPTRNDPLLGTLSEAVGGPLGEHAAPGIVRSGFWTPERVLIVLTTLAAVLGVVLKGYCRVNGWTTPTHFYATCYSDLPTLFKERGLAEGVLPFFTPDALFEYPVVMGLIAGATALLVPGTVVSEARATAYFDLNAVLITVMWLVAVVATARSNRRRPWDAAMLAIAPGAILAGFINWDMWAVAFTALGILAFARRRPLWAGVFIGLGTATKLYPIVILGAVLVLAVRTGRYRPLVLTAAGAAAAWTAVNLPFYLMNPAGWAYFLEFTRERPAGFSSVYFAWNLIAERLQWVMLDAPGINAIATASFLAACAAIAGMGLHAPRRPRLAQLAFLIVAAFVLTNKVYSPQFVVWLIPLLALARPRWRSFTVWMVVEALHWGAVWMYLGQWTSGGSPQNNIDSPYYVGAVLAHMGALLYLCARVVIDIYHPARDPVRLSRQDDPQGGEFDGAPDALTLASASSWARGRRGPVRDR